LFLAFALIPRTKSLRLSENLSDMFLANDSLCTGYKLVRHTGDEYIKLEFMTQDM
jgi:hypothetical protein